MKSKQPLAWRTLKFLVPTLLVILAIRILILDGFFACLLLALFVVVNFAVWILRGGVPNAEITILVLYGMFLLSMAWLHLFSERPFVGRGRQLIRRPPQKRRSVGTSRRTSYLGQLLRSRRTTPSRKENKHGGQGNGR